MKESEKFKHLEIGIHDTGPEPKHVLGQIQIPTQEKGAGLRGTMYYPLGLTGKAPGILYVHGWKSSENSNEELAKHRADEGNVCLTFNLRGHGTSIGDKEKTLRPEFLEDVKAAYDYLVTDPHVDSENITVVGASFGAYLGALLTKERSVTQLVMRAPANYPDKGFEDDPRLPTSDDAEVVAWRQQRIDWTGSKALAALHEFKGKALIVESGKDTVVPPETVTNYVEAIPNKENVAHVVMPDAPHSLSMQEGAKEKFQEIMDAWIKKEVEPTTNA